MDVVYLLVTAGVVLLDSEIKRYVDRTYACGESHPLGGRESRQRSGAGEADCGVGRIVIEKYYNRGAALNFLEKQPERMRVLHAGMLCVAGTCYAVLLCLPGRRLQKAGLALLVGGGASNLCDRLFKGHVVDYFRIDAGPRRFRRTIFNISDFCVFAGALLAAAGAVWEGAT